MLNKSDPELVKNTDFNNLMRDILTENRNLLNEQLNNIVHIVDENLETLKYNLLYADEQSKNIIQMVNSNYKELEEQMSVVIQSVEHNNQILNADVKILKGDRNSHEDLIVTVIDKVKELFRIVSENNNKAVMNYEVMKCQVIHLEYILKKTVIVILTLLFAIVSIVFVRT